MTDAAAPSRPSPWVMARVLSIRDETARARTIRLAIPEPATHRPGQHVVVRLTAPDGYTASRSYSIASAPDGSSELELTVERLDDGEVSGFLHDGLDVGDEIEIRGPIGGWFVWDGETPALLLAGGSGLVPVMSMLRFARLHDRSHLLRLVVSVRGPDDLLYADELSGPEVTTVFTRANPPGRARPPGRLTVDDLRLIDLPSGFEADGIAYVCGSAGFAGAATALVEALGHPADRIRVERFGPTA